MLMPKKIKYKKTQKGRRRNKGRAGRGTTIAFGEYGLKSTESRWITSRQIEACRKVFVRNFDKGGKLWIRIFPDKPVTKKGQELPMGGGKGELDHFVAPVKPGRIIFELTGLDEATTRKVFKKASHKLPVKTKIVKKK